MTTPTPVPFMATCPEDLAAALARLAEDHPDNHDPILAALCRAMTPDGVIEVTVTGVAKSAGVRLGHARDYLRDARALGALHVLGRRTDNGKVRYCAYRPEGV